jgi:cation/acetate symporter
MMAGSTQFPLLLLTLYWRKFTAFGAVAGMLAGLLASLWFVLPGGTKLENPGILAIPFGFAAAVLGTWLTRRPEEERRFDHILLRVHAGIDPRKGGSQECKS